MRGKLGSFQLGLAAFAATGAVILAPAFAPDIAPDSQARAQVAAPSHASALALNDAPPPASWRPRS